MSDIQVGNMREHTLSDGTVITQKLWEASDGLGPHCWCPAKSCVFCDRCIFYDYSNGPYMFVCELDEGKGMGDDFYTDKGAVGECEWFVEGEDE